MPVAYLNELVHGDQRLDSESETKFLRESDNELDYSYVHTHTEVAFCVCILAQIL